MRNFGWHHQNSLEEGIKKTYDFYRGLDTSGI